VTKNAKHKYIPNRARSDDYIRYLEKFGWRNIEFLPKKKLSQLEMRITKPYLYGRFRNCKDMDILSGILLARKCS
jgi:hypothetical protein